MLKMMDQNDSDCRNENEEKQLPLLEITSAHIAETEGTDKKYVLYTLQIRGLANSEDTSPATLERRYTDFYNLYNDLKREHFQKMSLLTFPKKVLTGNFDNKLISNRSDCFERLLKHILLDPKLLASKALLHFLQDVELNRAKQFLNEEQYTSAAPLLENNFRLLNKVYTDRSPAVLLALCRLLGCCVLMPGSPNAEKWADLALYRYENVSDCDILELYVPLLNVCKKIWWRMGRNGDILENRLQNLRLRGIKCNMDVSLLEAVDDLEKRLTSTSI